MKLDGRYVTILITNGLLGGFCLYHVRMAHFLQEKTILMK